MNQPWLTEKQIENLTRKARPSAQAKELDRAGIPYRMVAGRPVVLVQALSPVQQSDLSRPQVRKL